MCVCVCVCVCKYLFIKKYLDQTEMAFGTKLTPFFKHLGCHIAFALMTWNILSIQFKLIYFMVHIRYTKFNGVFNVTLDIRIKIDWIPFQMMYICYSRCISM